VAWAVLMEYGISIVLGAEKYLVQEIFYSTTSVLQWHNWLAHGTYNQYWCVSNAGVVSSSFKIKSYLIYETKEINRY